MQSMRLKCMFAPLLMTWDSIADPSPQTQSDDPQPLKAPSESCRPHKKRNMFLLRLVPGVGHRAQGCETSASNWRRVPATWLPMQTYTTAHTQMKMKGRGRENRNIKKQILKVQWAIFSVQHPQEEGVHDGVTLSTACLPGVLGCAAWCGVFRCSWWLHVPKVCSQCSGGFTVVCIFMACTVPASFMILKKY